MPYYIYNIKDTIRVPPSEMGGNIKNRIVKIAREEYESTLDEDLGIIVAVFNVDDIGDGIVVPGDGALHYQVNLNILTYKPEVQEVIEATVSQIAEFGAFVKIGPMEGLIHVSQIMDDKVIYDSKIPAFIGKETNKKLTINDTILARIVTVSLKETLANSKIGLTMRQFGLGKPEWKKIDEKEMEKVKIVKKKDNKELKENKK
ncbi:MAG: DNA-directed RNA polymerase [Candidatus Diapherotrites archaeon]|nr:DNA-directed RNA polymerase [Candidatus Diapherotrites archaeon]